MIKLANLVEKTEGSIHYIYTRQSSRMKRKTSRKRRILTKVYKLNYVRADELLRIIRPFLSADVGQKRIAITPSYRFGISESATFVSGGGAAMSAGGGGGGRAAAASGGGRAVRGPPPTGSGPSVGGYQPPTGGNSISDSDHLIVQDYESNLKIIDQIIQRIDVRPVQVLIEAVIVSVDLEHDRELGVNFAVVDNLANMLGTVGTGTALNGNVGFNPDAVADGRRPDCPGRDPGRPGFYLGDQRDQVRVRRQQRDRLRPGTGDDRQHQDPGQSPNPRLEQATRRDPARRPARDSRRCPRTSPAPSSRSSF